MVIVIDSRQVIHNLESYLGVFDDVDFPLLGARVNIEKITPGQLVQNGKVRESPKSTMTVH